VLLSFETRVPLNALGLKIEAKFHTFTPARAGRFNTFSAANFGGGGGDK